MSTASLPGYPPSHIHSPAYTVNPQPHEYRLAHVARLRPNRSPGEFIKRSKNGAVILRLEGQDDHATLPVYGYSASVQGTLDINKRDGITSVEVQVSQYRNRGHHDSDTGSFQIEGTLKLEELAEGGTANCKLCFNKSILWVKDRIYEAPCPSSLPFSLLLPTTFSDGGRTYVCKVAKCEHLG